MKAVLISIQPKWCELIASGKKTIEVRKTRPKIETPFKCYIYESKGKTKYWSHPMPIPYTEGHGKVIGEFVCNDIDEIRPHIEYNSDGYDIDDNSLLGICITREQLREYGKGNPLYGWRISDLKIYDKPKELGEFRTPFPFSKYCLNCEINENRTIKGFNTEYCSACSCFKDNLTRPPQSWCNVEELK